MYTLRLGTGDSNFTGRNSRRSAVGEGVGAQNVGGGGGVGAVVLTPEDCAGASADVGVDVGLATVGFFRVAMGVVLGDQMPVHVFVVIIE